MTLQESGRAVVFDLDGTLASTQRRHHLLWDKHGVRHEEPSVEGYRRYALACADDEPIQGTIALAQHYWQAGYKVFIVSGRDAAARVLTETWLFKHGVHWDQMYLWEHAELEDLAEFKIRKMMEIKELGYELALFVDDQAYITRRVRERLGIPTLNVSPDYGYVPTIRSLIRKKLRTFRTRLSKR